MNENTEIDDKKSFWGRVGRKPLPIQRILTENGPMRLKSQQSKPELKTSPGTPNPQDKENARLLEVSSCGPTSLTEDSSADPEWFSDAMSSTMAVSSISTPDRLKPGLFSISSNLSSINCSGPSSSSLSDGSLADKIFKTPKRKESQTSEASISSPHSTPTSHPGQYSSPNSSPASTCSVKTPGCVPHTPRTPSSSSWVSARTPTSNGSSKTPHSSGSVRTDSSTSSKTPNSHGGTRTPSSGTPSIRSVRTPSSSSSGTRWNPFDSHHSVDMMLHPTLSPNVFATVISPSQESESSCGRFWSIDQQAEMFPTTISEDSPLKQSIYVKNYSKDLESKTQEQIELYFAEHHVITSPPDLPPTGPLLVDSPNISYSQVEKKSVSTWSQTVLTFPPTLPPHVEQILKQFSTFQDPACPSSSQEETNNLSNSTLRRKLFNADMCSDSSRSPSPDSCPPSPTSPLAMLTPGRVIHTPLTSRNPGPTSAQWSSSPVKTCGRTTSFSPPDHMGSPMFSPIVKDRAGQSRSSLSRQLSQETVDSSVGESEDMQGVTSSQNNSGEVVGRDNCSRDLTAELSLPPSQDITGELYQTAEIDAADCVDSADTSAVVSMDVDSNSGVGWVVSQTPGLVSHSNTGEGWNSKSRTAEGWGASTISGEGWAVTLPDDTEGGSRVDTGYLTQNTASITNLTPSSPTPSPHPSLSRQDSGVCQQETTCGVSVLAPPPCPAPPQPSNPVLMSYHAADNSNDISVGFPLGSSTPTKK